MLKTGLAGFCATQTVPDCCWVAVADSVNCCALSNYCKKCLQSFCKDLAVVVVSAGVGANHGVLIITERLQIHYQKK